MNPTLLLLLAGAGVAVLAVAASSAASTSGDSELVASSKDMVDIFQFYQKKLYELTAEEVDQLGKLNAAAKGVPFRTLPQAMIDWASNPGDKSQADAIGEWKRTYYLPPGVDATKGPDLFTAWADTPDGSAAYYSWMTQHGPYLRCDQSFAGGLVSDACASDPNCLANLPPAPCEKGVYLDWFGRQIGTYTGDDTVHGTSDLSVIGKGIYQNFSDLWKAAGNDLLTAVAKVASNYPGIGTAVASGITFLQAVGAGASVENATIAAGRAAVPSTLTSAYDIGVGLATQKGVNVEDALSVAMATAISQGVVSGDVLEYYNSIKDSYDQAKAAGVEAHAELTATGDIISVATSAH